VAILVTICDCIILVVVQWRLLCLHVCLRKKKMTWKLLVCQIWKWMIVTHC